MPQFRFEVSVSESWGRTNIESARCNSDSDDNTGTCMDARGLADAEMMATGKKDDDREAELEAAIEKIRKEIWKPGQTLPNLRRAIASTLLELKH